MPTHEQSIGMSDSERDFVAGLMRVNHTGEICAQGLYEGQALVAHSATARRVLLEAADEERKHLGWCRTRIEELGSHTSVLDPVFYGSSVLLGALVGSLGDRISLGFVEATEDQVCEHLDRHLDRIPEKDRRSRQVLAAIRADEVRHGATARSRGGIEFPRPVRLLMTLASKVMTSTTRRL